MRDLFAEFFKGNIQQYDTNVCNTKRLPESLKREIMGTGVLVNYLMISRLNESNHSKNNSRYLTYKISCTRYYMIFLPLNKI